MEYISNFDELHDGHRLRQRDRIVDEGLEAMEEHEVLEYLLSLALPRQDVNDIAHNLMEKFGSLQAVARAELPELARVEGVGKTVAMWLALIGEAALAVRAVEKAPDTPVKINCLRDVLKDLDNLQRTYPAPCTVQICQDALGGTMYQRVITPSRMWAHPDTLRDAAGDVVSTGAPGVLMLQFVGKLHPWPGTYDIDNIYNYAFTLHAMGSCLLDMIIISYSGATSMRREGYVPDFKLKETAGFLRDDYVAALREDRTLRLITPLNQTSAEPTEE